ncbi:hypothetical protein [Kordiimonas sp.]|uniref:hypothetical protein n=1 Tax=Kordiimonas sp. TaxID=1970157 RepID=UPI003A8EECA3
MATKTRAGKRLTEEQIEYAAEALKTIEKELYLQRCSAASAVDRIYNMTWVKLTTTDLRRLRREHCKWFRVGELTADQKERATKVVCDSDFAWWYDRRNLTQARRNAETLCGFSLKPKEFRILINEHCKWFRYRRRVRPSTETTLDEKSWRRLSLTVAKMATELHGRPIDEAVAIVSTQRKCNIKLLDGLTSEYRVWEQAITA